MESNLPTRFTLVQQSNNEFIFITDTSITYKLTVFETDLLEQYPGIIYEFSFWPDESNVKKFDARVSNTVIYLIENLLQIKPEICISYICDSTDNRQVARKRLFEKWFLKYGNAYIKLDAEIKGTDYYHSLITNQNNPYLQHLNNLYFSAIIEYSK